MPTVLMMGNHDTHLTPVLLNMAKCGWITTMRVNVLANEICASGMECVGVSTRQPASSLRGLR